MHYSTKLLGWFFLLFISTATTAPASMQCAICGMEARPNAKTTFSSQKDGKPVHFCSFACAHRFHQKYKQAPLLTRDFASGKEIDGNRAFYLAKSKRILKELEFDMPPSVVAFGEESMAKSVQARLGDGRVVSGFEQLEKAYE